MQVFDMHGLFIFSVNLLSPPLTWFLANREAAVKGLPIVLSRGRRIFLTHLRQ